MSDLRDFLNWFGGYAENIEAAPDAKQWTRIKERVAALGNSAEVAFASPPVSPKAAPAPVKKVEMVYNFIIDHEGYARNGRTREQVLPSQVADTLFDLRGMDGDMKSIVWADGSTGLNGADLNIVAA